MYLNVCTSSKTLHSKVSKCLRGPFLLLPKGGDALLSSAHNELLLLLVRYLPTSLAYPHARLWKELLLYYLFRGK